MPLFKSIKDFILVKVLGASDSVGKFTNDVQKVTKRPAPAAQEDAAKYHYIWYLKALKKHKRDAALEVIAQELFRLILPRQPKYRRIRNHKGQFDTVIAKEIDGDFTCLDAPSPAELKENFASGAFKGLGEILIMSLFVNEADLKFGNMFVNDMGQVIKIDGNCCFFGNSRRLITATDLAQLPFLSDYGPSNWLDIRYHGKHDPGSKIFAKDYAQNIAFRREINETLLKIILLPRELLREFVDSYLRHGRPRAHIFAEIIERQNQLRAAALADPSFRAYMCPQQPGFWKSWSTYLFGAVDAQQCLNEFIPQLKEFHTTGKHGLRMDVYEKQIRDEFKRLEQLLTGNDYKTKATTYSNNFFAQVGNERMSKRRKSELFTSPLVGEGMRSGG